jgi:hypothetical protein
MLETTVGEVIDGFIPWRQISRAYFQAREEAAKPAVPPVTFAPPEVREFETEDEDDDSEEEDRPKVTLGEDVTLEDEEDDDNASISTEDELRQKATESVALNL